MILPSFDTWVISSHLGQRYFNQTWLTRSIVNKTLCFEATFLYTEWLQAKTSGLGKVVIFYLLPDAYLLEYTYSNVMWVFSSMINCFCDCINLVWTDTATKQLTSEKKHKSLSQCFFYILISCKRVSKNFRTNHNVGSNLFQRNKLSRSSKVKKILRFF